MAWQAGVTRATGFVVTATIWNAYNGASGNFDILFDGTKIQTGLVGTGSILTTSVHQMARLGLGQAADATAVMAATGQYFSTQITVAALDVDCIGNVQYKVLANGAQTLTFSHPKAGGRYVLYLKQPASGAAGTVTWPATVKWSGGSAPTLTTTNARVDIFGFGYETNSAKYIGSFLLNFNVA